MNTTPQLLPTIEVRDVLDVALVFVTLRYLLGALQGTRALQILQGVGVILLIWALANFFGLKTMASVLNWFLVSLAVIVPVIFQPELRRALMRLGQQGMLTSSPLARMEKEELVPLIDELAYATYSMGQVRMGAIIVLEREVGLQDYIEQGTPLDSLISLKLLLTIFHPKTHLHDGAVILRGNRIMAAGCTLDVHHDQETDDRLGTRHRAALSVSSQSDCLALVVSEETGQIRIAHDGRFSRPLVEEGEIKKILAQYLVTAPGKPRTGPLQAIRGLRSRKP